MLRGQGSEACKTLAVVGGSEGEGSDGGGGIWTAREAGEVMNTYIYNIIYNII